MNALRYAEFGGPEKLKVQMVQTPKPGQGEVLVRVRCGGLNFADVLILNGNYPTGKKLPSVLGFEAAGEIEALGPGVAGLAKGQRVACIHPSAFAEFLVCPADKLIFLPEGMDFETAAALPVQGLTAWGLLNVSHRVQAGEKVLVHSAAGGVGGLAVQLAKAAGATVFGTVSSADKAKPARELGCSAVIDRKGGDFAAELLRLTGGKGADLILDGVGKETFLKDFEAAAPFGHVVVYGQAGGSPDPLALETLWKGSKKASAFYLQDLMADPARAALAFKAVTEAVLGGTLKVVIGGKYRLADAAAAVQALKEGRSVGKLILQVG